MLLLLLVRVRVSKPSQYSVVASNEFLAWPQPSSATQLVATSQHTAQSLRYSSSHFTSRVCEVVEHCAPHSRKRGGEKGILLSSDIAATEEEEEEEKVDVTSEQAVEEETTDAKICCLVFIDCAHIFLGSPKCIYMYRCCCKRSFCCCCWVQYLEL